MFDETVATLSEEAASAVRAHIALHLDADGQSWLLQGTRYAAGAGDCPYCGQALSTSVVAGLFPRFFDEAYIRLKERIEKGIARLVEWQRWRGELAEVERANLRALADWRRVHALVEPPDLAGVGAAAEELVDTLRMLLEEKRGRSLDPLGSDARVGALLTSHTSLTERMAGYNEWALRVSAGCASLVQGAEQARRELREEVRGLRARLLRGNPGVVTDLGLLDQVNADLTKSKNDAEAAQTELDRWETTRTKSFLDRVNAVLDAFGAGFSLKDFENKPSSARVTSDFSIALREGGHVRASAKREREPRPDTVLSEGDRTTLALAVFLSTVRELPDLSERTVVLDDPLTSLDRGRRRWTAAYISELSATAQVIVLSHDEYFLRDVLPKGASQLQLRHEPGRALLDPWDADVACRSRYFSWLDGLEMFVDGNKTAPSANDAWSNIRNVLEEYLRFRFPRAWQERDWLGDFLRKAHAAHPDIPLSVEAVARIGVWCGFSSPAHHADPAFRAPAPGADEVQNVARQVLRFVHG